MRPNHFPLLPPPPLTPVTFLQELLTPTRSYRSQIDILKDEARHHTDSVWFSGSGWYGVVL